MAGASHRSTHHLWPGVSPSSMMKPGAFSFNTTTAPLDMRGDSGAELSAYEVVKRLSAGAPEKGAAGLWGGERVLPAVL